jgi:hypothetical protein
MQPTAMVAMNPPAVTSQVDGGGIRVGLVTIQGEIVTLQVVNLTDQPVVLDRNAIKMVMPLGEQRTRFTTPLSNNVFGIPGGGIQLVRLHYDLTGVLDTDVVQLDFSDAIRRDGQPVAVPRFAYKPKA